MAVTIIPSWSEKQVLLNSSLLARDCLCDVVPKCYLNELVYDSFDSGRSRYIYPVVYDNV